jgi:hypothetical protein
MTVVSKFTVVPLVFLSAVALVTALKPNTLTSVTLNNELAEDARSFISSDWTAQYRPFESDSSQIDGTPTQPLQVDNVFHLLVEAELARLSQDELLMYMLEFRNQRLFETDFMAEEYRLFQTVLDVEPYAALDYMVAIGHDASSEFFYNFLYTDFMVNDGKSDEVVEYINRFGPDVSLMNLITFANLTDHVSTHVRREVLNEYILGNAEYHNIIKIAQWQDDLTPDEKVTAFINTVPVYVEDAYGLIRDVVALDNPSTYDHLLQFLIEHPDRYRLYRLMRSLNGIDIYPIVEQLMTQFDTMTINGQIQTALIAIDFGVVEALNFLATSAQKPLILSRPINVEYAVLAAVKSPDYVDKNLTWVATNVDAFVFNPYTRKFEY